MLNKKIIKRKEVPILIHVIIAFILLPFYQEVGEEFKILVAPYIIYMFWREDSNYFPALIVHAASGSTISFLILLLCFIKTILNFNILKSVINKWILILSLLPAPILFYQAFYRLFISNLGFIESILPLGLFLGIFPFYYGLIIADKINPKVLKSIGIVLIFFLLINSLNFINGLRAATFSLVLFSSSGVLLLIPTKKELKLPAFYRVISSIIIVFIIIGLYQLTFHFLLSFLLSLLIILFYTKKNNWLLYNLVSKRILYASIFFIIFVVANTYNFSEIIKPIEVENSYRNLAYYPELIMFKTFGDRGVIWSSVWSDIIYQKLIIPPLVVADMNYLTLGGENITVDFGAHNLFLELMRIYGMLFGIIITFVYATLMLHLGKVFFRKVNIYVLLFAATAFGIGIVVGITGTYTLMINFSFLLMGIAGVCYKYFHPILLK